MKIKKVILENYRAFYGRHEIELNDFTVFIGKNDQGKSTILEAIDIFINEGKGVAKIDNNDLNIRAKQEGIDQFSIGIVFENLPEKTVIDATNETNLKYEYLLNQEGDLEIYKIFKNGKLAEKETYIRCYHPSNDDFLKDLLKKKIKDLQDFVNKNNIQCSDNRISAELRKGIREYYKSKDGELKFEVVDIKVNEEGLKDIWNKLEVYIPVYSLFHSDRTNTEQDSEIQDPLKSKIEQIFKREDIQNKLCEIANEIDKELKNVADTTIKKYREVCGQQDSILPNIPEVTSLKWKDVYKNIGYNTGDGIPLNKRGSGIRRLMLVSSFLAELELKNNENNHVIYAIEEPETSLHPDLQKILIDSLIKLSKQGKYQIFITTHSPALIRLFETESIRYVEKSNGITKVEKFNETIADKIVKNLGLLPNIGKVVICLEGTNDENFLFNINQNIEEFKNIIDLKIKTDAGIISIIPMNGSNLKDWINRYALKNTNVLEFHLYDKDKDEKYTTAIEKVNGRKDGSFGTLTNKREIENYVPKELIESEFNINLSHIADWNNADIANEVKQKVNNKKENDIKSIICGKLSQEIKKEDLDEESFNEIKGWFERIKEMCDKVTI
ncbi:MAG: ATP-binding protein [Paludibacteraceae bacterium]|nr:ATP-binding protein [Paludibacteraceae bacterium]